MSLKDALCGSLFYALIWWTFKESRKVPRSESESERERARKREWVGLASSSLLPLKCAFLVCLHINVKKRKIEQRMCGHRTALVESGTL